jgi:purine-binding chemotaxis protein CheW
MDFPRHLVVFALDDHQFALPLEFVDRVVRAVEVVLLPGAPRIVKGIINLHGQIVPVISLRLRCGLPEREVEVDEQFIIARTPTRTVALQVDSTHMLQAKPDDCIPTSQFVPESMNVGQVVKSADGLILVQNIETLLSSHEDQALAAAIKSVGRSN